MCFELILMIIIAVVVLAPTLLCLLCVVASTVEYIQQKVHPEKVYLDDDKMHLWMIALPLVVGVALSYLEWYIISCGISSQKEYKSSYEIKMCEIISLERESSVYGRFTLGSGVIQEKSYYFYYYKIDANVYKLGRIECDKSYIIECNNTPAIYKVKEENVDRQCYHFEIYVPYNTIVVSYTA